VDIVTTTDGLTVFAENINGMAAVAFTHDGAVDIDRFEKGRLLAYAEPDDFLSSVGEQTVGNELRAIVHRSDGLRVVRISDPELTELAHLS